MGETPMPRTMAIEIEMKMSVPELESVRAKLHAIGGKWVSLVLETNVFFDASERLRMSDRGVRLRTSRDVGTGNEAHVLTYKGPRQPSVLKQREEIEVMVNDPRAAEQLL